MENSELIEKYVSGRLDGVDKETFEQQIKADPTLQSDVALQKQIVEGIKKARIQQLKTMLNQVPVGPAAQVGFSAGQIVASAITATILVTGTLFYFKPWAPKADSILVTKESPANLDTKDKEQPSDLNESKPNNQNPLPLTPEPTKEPATITSTKPAAKTNTAKPKLEVVDPTDELTQSQSEGRGTEKSQAVVVASHVVVETDYSNEKYSFHYQFHKGKLMLFGAFDKGLYEILEVHGENHSIFLYYKDNYYLLNEQQVNITPLKSIKDTQLIKLLKEYRGK